MKIPLESAHLRKSKDDDPQRFEKLCVEHEAIKQTNNEAQEDIDPSTVDYLCEIPIEDWNLVSEDYLTSSMADPAKK